MFLFNRRKDSKVNGGGGVQVSKTDFSQAAKSTDIIINPGANQIELNAKVLSSVNFVI